MSTPDQPADFAGRFMEDYFAECEEHLIAVRRSLLALEAAIGSLDPPAAIVEELFRSFHSLKGISAMVELHDAERLAHEMESCLRAIDGGARCAHGRRRRAGAGGRGSARARRHAVHRRTS
jgi:two-component system chemotaxis sensor kinase CheA